MEEAPKYGQPKVDITANDNYAVRWAAENDHLDVIKYLVEDAPYHTGQIIQTDFYISMAYIKNYLHSKSEFINSLMELNDSGIPYQNWKDIIESKKLNKLQQLRCKKI